MFARFLEMTVKPGMKPQLIDKIRGEVLPILKKYSGFIDVIPLEVETEAKVYAVSLWHDKLDAEKYDKENFAKVKAIYEPFLTMPLVVRLCKVDETIFKKAISIAA